MGPTQHDAREESDADLTQAIRHAQKNQQFAEAYRLGKTQLERIPQSESKLAGFIKNAHDAGLLDECADFLVDLAEQHSDDADLLNYTAGLLGEMGQHQQSRALAIRAAARRPFFPSRTKNIKLHVLALQCIATGDYRYSPLSARFYFPGITDLYTLLDPAIAVHRLLVDDLSAAVEAVQSLPQCDIVLNTISDPDYEQSLHNAATICDALGLPVFNSPRQVRKLNRASLPAVVHGKSDKLMSARSVYLPPGRTKNSDISATMENEKLAFPVIIRASGFQGGQHMKRIDNDIKELGVELYRGNGVYIIELIDVSFQDPRATGCLFYPKYRAFFANGQLFPMHLLVSDQYEVHKKTSDPVRTRHPWLLDMEAEYVQDPEQHLPQGLWAALKTGMSSFGLDYCGVDFAVSTRPEDCGKLVLFECNAAMANRIGVLPEGSQIQRQWHDVTQAAHMALCTKSGVKPWPFVLKKGLLLSLGK
ncbi:MAG: hypothetical protein LUC93_18240 [Planctomycetaceae bacterium]|nr:hypothetical protein [Planctomycetaceae bacterium]